MLLTKVLTFRNYSSWFKLYRPLSTSFHNYLIMSMYGTLQEDKTEPGQVPLAVVKNPLHTEGLDRDFLKSTSDSFNNDNNKDLVHKDDSTVNSKCWSPMKIISSLAVEAVMFIYMFSFMVGATITTNMLMDKACRFRLNFSSEICSNLSNRTAEKEEVEKIAIDFNLYLNLLTVGPGAFLMMFIGPWSDKYGRKPPLLATIGCAILSDVGMILNSYFFEVKLEYMLLSSVPAGLAGGNICLRTVMFSLASELNTKTKRTLKFAFVELANGLGVTCGTLVGGLIYDYSKSYIAVYGTTIAGHIISGIWVILVITETKGLNSEESWKQKLSNVLTFERVVEGFKACLKVRENRGRTKIWLIFGSTCLIVFTYESFSNIGYTYVHHRFDWDAPMYSYVMTIVTAIGIGVMTISIPVLTRVFKIGDEAFGIIGTVSAMAKNICIGLASKPWIFLMGNILGLLLTLATLAAKSMLSKLVPEDELGKMFSFTSICEALVPLAGTIVITKIFNATISVFPGLCYLIASVLLVLPLGAYIWIASVKSNG